MNLDTPLVILCLALVAPLGAQSLTLAEGPGPSQLQIRVHDEGLAALPSKVFLDRVEFLPLEITLRTAMQEFRTDRARRVHRQGLWRVELPGGGRIFHYRRKGGAHYGFLLVLANGTPVVLLELPGIGTGGVQDPFADRFGVARDGRHAAFATIAGTLHVARLDGGVYASSKAPARPIAVKGIVEAKSLTVGTRVLYFTTDKTRLWRLGVGDSSQPVEIGPTIAAGGRIEEEMAINADGSRLAFLAGPKKLQHIYLAGESGTAARLTTTAAKYEDAGYLPETQMGPTLMLDDTGFLLFYVDSTLREELYLRDLRKPLGTLHITNNANFQPYIGTGVLPVYVSGKLMVGIGNPKAFDWYLADAAQGTVQNLSLSPGNTTAPFGAGLLDVQGSAVLAGQEAMVVQAQTGGLYRLGLFPAQTTQKPRFIDGLAARPTVGTATQGSGDLLLKRQAGDLLLDESQVGLLIGAPAGLGLDHPIKTPAFRFFTVEFAGYQMPVFYQPGQFFLALPPQAGTALPVLSPGGALVLHGTQLQYFGPRWATSLPAPKGLRLVLSGQGA